MSSWRGAYVSIGNVLMARKLVKERDNSSQLLLKRTKQLSAGRTYNEDK
jgi:hypothetical protein